MDSYRIFETERFQKDLKKILRGALPKIESKLREYVYPQLKKEPHFGPNIKRLKGWEPATWRYRVGEWRFFYEIDEAKRVVATIAADHRSETY